MRRGGEALGCIHHFADGAGCGHADACRSCAVRNSVKGAAEGAVTHRRLTRMELRTPQGTTPIHVLVTAVPFLADQSMTVLLTLEDVSTLIQLEDLLPICAWCKKVRSGEKYWEAVETYLRRKLEVSFSHGICEECEKKFVLGKDDNR